MYIQSFFVHTDAEECDEEDLIVEATEDEPEIEEEVAVKFDDADVDDDYDDDYYYNDDEGVGTERLWPCKEVRQKWIKFLIASKTVSEVALALSAFVDHCKAFNALGPDPLDLYGMNKSKGGMYTTNRSSRSLHQGLNTPSRGRALKKKSGNKRKR